MAFCRFILPTYSRHNSSPLLTIYKKKMLIYQFGELVSGMCLDSANCCPRRHSGLWVGQSPAVALNSSLYPMTPVLAAASGVAPLFSFAQAAGVLLRALLVRWISETLLKYLHYAQPAAIIMNIYIYNYKLYLKINKYQVGSNFKVSVRYNVDNFSF
jgi:hypothetical protein